MRKKRRKLGVKFYGAVVLVIAMLGAVILISYKDGRKAERQREAAAAHIEKEKQGQASKESDETENKNERNRETEELQAAYIKVENQKEFIEPVLGSYTYKLGQEVWAFVQKADLDVTTAKCLDCSIPLDDPSVTEFYLELDDKEKTLLTASYKAETCDIEISSCQYSREEIADSVWMLDNGPAVRDAEDKK